MFALSILLELSAGTPYEAKKQDLSPSLARIEWIRKQLSWAMGKRYIPSRIVAQLKGFKNESKPVQVESDAVQLSGAQNKDSVLKNHYSKRRIYRWRCKSCRIFSQSQCPRCGLDLEASKP